MGLCLPQQLVQKVNGLWGDEVCVVRVDKLGPRLARVQAHDAVKVRIQLQIILVQVLEQLICAEHLGDANELVVVVVAVEEWLLLENLRRTSRGGRTAGSVESALSNTVATRASCTRDVTMAANMQPKDHMSKL